MFLSFRHGLPLSISNLLFASFENFLAYFYSDICLTISYVVVYCATAGQFLMTSVWSKFLVSEPGF